jgi:hypothetical protein
MSRDVAVVYRWAENQINQLPALADDLVRRQVSVISASGGTDASDDRPAGRLVYAEEPRESIHSDGN